VLCSSLVAFTRRILKFFFFFYFIFLLLLLLLTSDSRKTNVTKAPFLACSSARLWPPTVPRSYEKGLEEFNSCVLAASFRFLLLIFFYFELFVLVLRVSRTEPHGMLCAPVQTSCSLVPPAWGGPQGGGCLGPPPGTPSAAPAPRTMGKRTAAVNRSCWLCY